MTENPNPLKPEWRDPAELMAMREPPGRLGAIVRRLKQMPPMPPPLIAKVASVEGVG